MAITKTKSPKKYLDRNLERELIKKYQETDDNKYLEPLLIAHSAYIQKVASEQYQKLGKIVEYEDLVQEGRIGLIKAIKKFDLNRVTINPNTNKIVANQALLTYAHSKIVAEMQSLSHRSNATHIPAHTLRAIKFNVKKPGSNTEERKELARRAMKSESLNVNFGDNVDKDYEKKNLQILISNGNDDPTFDESILNVFSPQNENAISMLSPIEWKIVQMRLGLLKGEEGIKTKPDFIADILGLSVEVVEKSFKRAKRILSKHLINIKG